MSHTPAREHRRPLDTETIAFLCRTVVHEIAGVVPDSVVNSLLAAIGIDTESGMLDLDIVGNKNGQGYKKDNTTVKKIGRQGYSAGQVLQQVS